MRRGNNDMRFRDVNHAAAVLLPAQSHRIPVVASVIRHGRLLRWQSVGVQRYADVDRAVACKIPDHNWTGIGVKRQAVHSRHKAFVDARPANRAVVAFGYNTDGLREPSRFRTENLGSQIRRQ